MRQMKRIVAVVFCLAMVCGTTLSSVHATQYSVSMVRLSQEKSLWCWAANARMHSSFKYQPPLYTQEEIVRYVKNGSAANVTASTSEITKAIKFALGGNTTVSATNAITFSQAQTKIQTNKRPFSIGLQTTDGGHVVLIDAVETDNSSVRIVDPNPSVTTRSFYTVSSLTDLYFSKYGRGLWVNTWYW